MDITILSQIKANKKRFLMSYTIKGISFLKYFGTKIIISSNFKFVDTKKQIRYHALEIFPYYFIKDSAKLNNRFRELSKKKFKKHLPGG